MPLNNQNCMKIATEKEVFILLFDNDSATSQERKQTKVGIIYNTFVLYELNENGWLRIKIKQIMN